MTQRPDAALDGDRARAVLARHLGHDVGPVELVGEGSWSRCFGFVDDGRDLVVRLGPSAEDFGRDLRAAGHRTAALPVPAVLAVGRAGEVAFAVSERVRGRPIEQLDQAWWAGSMPTVLALIDSVAAMARPADGGYGPWGPGGHGTLPTWRAWLLGVADDDREPRLRGWRHHLADHPRTATALDAGLARLAELADAGAGRRRAVHGDLVNRNVLARGSDIVGVLDWGCALDGDPALSWSELELWAPWHPGMAGIDVRTEVRRHLRVTGGDAADLDARIDAGAIYLALAGLTYWLATGAEGQAAVEDRAQVLRLLDGYLAR